MERIDLVEKNIFKEIVGGILSVVLYLFQFFFSVLKNQITILNREAEYIVAENIVANRIQTLPKMKQFITNETEKENLCH